MRSDMLLKLTKTYGADESERFKNVGISGPHDLILIQMRLEEHKEQPDMTTITPERCDVPLAIFPVAVSYLQKHGYIEGAVITRDDREFPLAVDLSAVRLTEAGIAFEKTLG